MRSLTGRQKYNLVTDLVLGPNVRLSDNLFQGIAILLCALVGAGAGYVLSGPLLGPSLGAGLGIAAGMTFGVIVSGTYLMAYRGIQHARGRHD